MKKNKVIKHVKIVKAMEITPGHKYLLILPKNIHEDEQVAPALYELFKDCPFVTILTDRPQDIKIVKVNPEDAKTNS